jgi:hypothetical protein
VKGFAVVWRTVNGVRGFVAVVKLRVAALKAGRKMRDASMLILMQGVF